MVPVAESMGVRLHSPLTGRYAFYNSPYPSHQLNTGVDIYPGDGFGGEVPSPVEGEVVLIRRLKAPEGHGFVASDHETVILIRNGENPETFTKLLHVDPLVGVGDWVQIGEPVGASLRSGYYGWGTSPHVHCEVRNPEDPLRARGGYNLDLIDFPGPDPLDEIVGEITHVQPEFVFMRLLDGGTGLAGTVNGETAFLDGGIPYYGWLGAHLFEAPFEGTIELTGVPIADINHSFKHSCTAQCRSFYFTANKAPIMGLSLTLWPNKKPLVKLYPSMIGGFDLKIGDLVEVELSLS